MKANFGDELSPFKIQTLKLANGQQVIGSIVSTSIIISKTHYIDGGGSIHCFSGSCCADNGLPSVRYGLPVYLYPTEKGKRKVPQITEGPLEFRMLVRGWTDYNNLKTKSEILQGQGSDITKAALLITCTEQQYQRYEFELIGEGPWRERVEKEQYRKDITDFLAFGEVSLGRKVDEAGYQKMVGAIAAPVVDRPQIMPAVAAKQPEQLEFDDVPF